MLYRRSLETAQALGDLMESTFEVQGIAMSLAGLGVAARALRLGGAVEAEWKRLGADFHIAFWDRFLERYLGRARAKLGPEEAARAWEEGTRVPIRTAIAEALAWSKTSGAGREPPAEARP